MNKKGYTLIELIGVIVVISLMVLLASTLSNRSIKETNQRVSKQCEENIIMAARNWTLDNKDKIDGSINISINTLQNEGYIEKKDCSNNNKCVKIETKLEGNRNVYNYKIIDEC